MRKLYYICTIVLLLALAVMVVNRFWYQFPDWAIRVAGMSCLVGILLGAFARVRMMKK